MRLRPRVDRADSPTPRWLVAVGTKLRKVVDAWTWGYAAGRIAAHNAAQRHWAGTVASLIARAQRAEADAAMYKGALDGMQRSAFRNAVRAERLEAILQTRNLSGGFFPNGQDIPRG